MPVASQILELRRKSFDIDICVTTTWNSHFFVLLRINVFFLASTTDTSPSSFVKHQPKIDLQILNKLSKLVSWLLFLSDAKWLSLFVSCMDFFFFQIDTHVWIRCYSFLCLLFLITRGYWCQSSFRGLAFWLLSVRKRHCRNTWLKNIYCNPLSLEQVLIHGTSDKKKSKKETEKKLEHLKAQTLEIPEAAGKEGKNTSMYIWKR